MAGAPCAVRIPTYIAHERVMPLLQVAEDDSLGVCPSCHDDVVLMRANALARCVKCATEFDVGIVVVLKERASAVE